jgi:hypothetical protein
VNERWSDATGGRRFGGERLLEPGRSVRHDVGIMV